MTFTSKKKLIFHHVGCLTENISLTLKTYTEALGFENVSEIYFVKDQKVKVCFVETSPNIFIEFIEPTENNPALRKLLKSGNPYYHVGYTTKDIDRSIKELVLEEFRLVNLFYSEAFANKRCAFLYSPEMNLIELIEA